MRNPDMESGQVMDIYRKLTVSEQVVSELDEFMFEQGSTAE